MKIKKRFFTIAVAMMAISISIGYRSVMPKSAPKALFAANVEALSDGDLPALYTRTTGDCVISASAGTSVSLKFLGVTIASAKAGVDGQVVFKDIQVVCEAGGRTLCSPKECADFYIDIIKANKDDDHENN